MKTRTVHRLVGYDRFGQRIAEEFDIPVKNLGAVKKIANVAPADPDAIGSYPLNTTQAQQIAALIQEKIDTERNLFYLEPFAIKSLPARVA